MEQEQNESTCSRVGVERFVSYNGVNDTADLKNLLDHSYSKEDYDSKIDFLSQEIFDFTTYDSGEGSMSEIMGKYALGVCLAIKDKKTFRFIEDEENYKWFIVMCNLPFFSGKLEWGTSIRGAWFDIYLDKTFIIHSCGLWAGEDQMLELELNDVGWGNFIDAMDMFVNGS